MEYLESVPYLLDNYLEDWGLGKAGCLARRLVRYELLDM